MADTRLPTHHRDRKFSVYMHPNGADPRRKRMWTVSLLLTTSSALPLANPLNLFHE